MPDIFNVLIIEDHPFIADAYKAALNLVAKNKQSLKFNIDTACNCDDAMSLIKASSGCSAFHLVFLDINLPSSKDRKILSGEDLGIKIKAKFKTVKVIVITSHNDNYRIYNILKNLNPDGFMIKDDISMKNLIEAIETIISDSPYYSKTVFKLIRKNLSNDFVLDKIDRQILYHMSIGSKMKDLPKVLPLSKAGVERRKRNLRRIFNADFKDDKSLVQLARERGFI